MSEHDKKRLELIHCIVESADDPRHPVERWKEKINKTIKIEKCDLRTKIIMAIHPEYVTKIFAGTKKYEYRKKMADDVRVVLMYATAPESSIMGSFTVKKILRSSPELIWQSTYTHAGISKSKYDEYFAGCKNACAMEIGQVTWFNPHRTIKDYFLENPPQSWHYICYW